MVATAPPLSEGQQMFSIFSGDPASPCTCGGRSRRSFRSRPSPRPRPPGGHARALRRRTGSRGVGHDHQDGGDTADPAQARHRVHGGHDGSMGGSIANVQANASVDPQPDPGAPSRPRSSRSPSTRTRSTACGGLPGRPAAHRQHRRRGHGHQRLVGRRRWRTSPRPGSAPSGRIPSTINFRPDGTRVLVMFGDAPSHDPVARLHRGHARPRACRRRASG